MTNDDVCIREESWASSPSVLLRLEQIVKLSQRTSFILELMGLPERDTKLLKKTLKTIADHSNVTYHPPSGKGGGQKRAQAYTTKVRFGLSVLMGLLSASSDDGLTGDGFGGIGSGDWVDRLINTYHMYLHTSGQISVQEPDVSFEWFYYSFREVQQGHAQVEHCDNCGSIHHHFHDAPAKGCPVCSQLKLAILPKQPKSAETWVKRNKSTFKFNAFTRQNHSTPMRATAYS